MLRSVKHPNIVTLLGTCLEGSEMILVTKNVSNGYLCDYLKNVDDMRILSWEKRLKICIDVARALKYLHYEMEDRKVIIHRDISSRSIALDENWGAKIVDFWWSLFLPPNQEDATDPRYKKTYKLKRESDVYDFGVVLFEILCGRSASVARQSFSMGALEDMVDPILKEETSENTCRPNKDSLHTFVEIAQKCLADTQDQRPTMKVVARELMKALLFQLQEKKFQHLKIPLSDIIFATDNFSDRYKIASWDDYSLYRAELNHYDEEVGESREHPKVVIKRYPSGHDEYGEEKFYTEVEMLSSVKHPNIATLRGICLEGSEMILVTENVSNGYLCDYLKNVNDMRILSWDMRLKICIDVARALKYLHCEMEDQKTVIHRDISSRSIALDENWGAKIVDFWRSSFLPPNQVDKKTCKVKREPDVYDFGVVLFEILCGRSSIDPIFYEESDKGLAFVARWLVCSGTLEDMIDPILKEETSENNIVQYRKSDKDSLRIFIEIAHKCVAETKDQRPTMKDVVKELKDASLYQVSCCLYVCFSQHKMLCCLSRLLSQRTNQSN